jgi:DDE domain
VLDEIVQIRRDTKAARRLLVRLLRKQGRPPKRIITDKLGSYAAAKRAVMPRIEHRQHKGLNNRAENSHVPIRKRERMMQSFRSWPGLQQFVSTFSAVRNHFVPPRSQRSALSTHLHRLRAKAEWKHVTAVSSAGQGKSGLGIEAQRAAVARFAEAEDFEVVAEYIEVESGKGADALDHRPILKADLAVRRYSKRLALNAIAWLYAQTA